MTQDPTPREMGYYMALAQVGFEMVVPIAVGFWLDGWLATTPWITSIAAVVGFVVGLLHIVVLTKRKERDESSRKSGPGKPTGE